VRQGVRVCVDACMILMQANKRGKRGGKDKKGEKLNCIMKAFLAYILFRAMHVYVMCVHEGERRGGVYVMCV